MSQPCLGRFMVDPYQRQGPVNQKPLTNDHHGRQYLTRCGFVIFLPFRFPTWSSDWITSFYSSDMKQSDVEDFDYVEKGVFQVILW